MELTLARDTRTTKTTTGTLALNGVVSFCTLEDVDRGLDSAKPETLKGKIRGVTCIPYGRFPVRRRWSEKHQCFLYGIFDVPSFQNIEFHAGNYAKNTLGCVLLGTKRSVDFVGNSRAAVRLFEAQLDAVPADEEIWINIVRG